MARFFLGEGALPAVSSVRDVYEVARGISERGIPVRKGEAELLKQVTWCMLQIQHDHEEGELHQALARLAAQVLAIIEDDDLYIPDELHIGGRVALEGLALQLGTERAQLDMSLGVAIGMYDLVVQSGADLQAIAGRLPPERLSDELQRAVRGAALHLRQGEELHRRHGDPQRAAAHGERLQQAYQRTTYLLARLLAVPPERDHPVLRAHILRRELKHIEVDALGVQRLTEAEQAREARRLLAWTEEELGEELTDENKAALAARLREAAREQAAEQGETGEGDWLAGMD